MHRQKPFLVTVYPKGSSRLNVIEVQVFELGPEKSLNITILSIVFIFINLSSSRHKEKVLMRLFG